MPPGRVDGEDGLSLAHPEVVAPRDGRAPDKQIVAFASKRSFESVDYDEWDVAEVRGVRAAGSSVGAPTSSYDDSSCDFSLERDVEKGVTMDNKLGNENTFSHPASDAPAAFKGLSTSTKRPKGRSAATPHVSSAPALISSGTVLIWQGGQIGEGENTSTTNEAASEGQFPHAGVDVQPLESAETSFLHGSNHGASAGRFALLSHGMSVDVVSNAKKQLEGSLEGSEAESASQNQRATGPREEGASSSDGDLPVGTAHQSSGDGGRALVTEAAIRRPNPSCGGQQTAESFECRGDGHEGSESKANLEPNAGTVGPFSVENTGKARYADQQSISDSEGNLNANTNTSLEGGSADGDSSEDEQYNPSVSVAMSIIPPFGNA